MAAVLFAGAVRITWALTGVDTPLSSLQFLDEPPLHRPTTGTDHLYKAREHSNQRDLAAESLSRNGPISNPRFLPCQTDAPSNFRFSPPRNTIFGINAAAFNEQDGTEKTFGSR